jgi:hypothetical protein
MTHLLDPAHIHHDAAHAWFREARTAGWATCPITENGLVRVLSNPAYPGRRTTVSDAADRLGRFTGSGGHTFWADEVSILDADAFTPGQLSGHRQITDAYLLALAVRHDACLATFDRNVPTAAVMGCGAESVTVLSVGR